jgi:CMP-2-keto-3-deoxyoctulosonic acid synthetase
MTCVAGCMCHSLVGSGTVVVDLPENKLAVRVDMFHIKEPRNRAYYFARSHIPYVCGDGDTERDALYDLYNAVIAWANDAVQSARHRC